MVKVRFIGKIAPGVRDIIRRIAKALPQVTEIRHSVQINVAPAPTVGDPDGKSGFAAFLRRDCSVWVGGEPVPEIASDPESVRDFYLQTIAHEFAHYEQFRDGRRLQERGVKVRGRTLERRIIAAMEPGP